MDIIAVCNEIQTNGFAIVRLKKNVTREKGQPYQYDVKHSGKKKGWFYFDSFTAGAVLAVYNSLNEQNKAKFSTLHLVTILDFVWKHVK
jgi:hypothetical protein